MSKSDKRILITGFEPFDGDEINPSSVLLDWLNTQQFNFEIETQLLPVSFTKAFPILDMALEEFNPTAVILTGLAKNRTELTLERIAINWVDARIPDNDGLVLKSQKIIESSCDDGLFTTIPLEKMLEACKIVGCPCKISSSAGEYVCNHIIYLYLAKMKALNKNIPGTFIHLPGSNDYQIFFQGIVSILNSI